MVISENDPQKHQVALALFLATFESTSCSYANQLIAVCGVTYHFHAYPPSISFLSPTLPIHTHTHTHTHTQGQTTHEVTAKTHQSISLLSLPLPPRLILPPSPPHTHTHTHMSVRMQVPDAECSLSRETRHSQMLAVPIKCRLGVLSSAHT